MQFRVTKARIIQMFLACLCFFAPLLLILTVPRASIRDTWRSIGMEGSKVAAVFALKGQSEYLCATEGLGVWRLQGSRWTAVNEGLPTGAWGQIPAVHLTVHEGPQTRLYLGLGDRSDSVGFYSQAYPGTWLLLRSGFGREIIRAVALEPDSGVIYVATDRTIYHSVNRGLTWDSSAVPAGASAPTVLEAHPRKPGELWFGTSAGELYISPDRGMTWRLSQRLSLERSVNSIALDPFEPGIAYMAAGASVYVTKDGGETWDRQSLGLGSGFAVSLAVDPAVRGGVFLASNPDGVYRSENYGRTWVPFREGMGRMGVNSLALDPLDYDTLIAGTDNGVWSCSLTWLRSGAGVEIPPPFTPTPLPATPSPTPTSSRTPTATRTRTPTLTATATQPAASSTPTRTLSPSQTANLTPSPTSTTAVFPATGVPRPSATPAASGPSPTFTTAPTATPTRPPR